MFLLLPSLVAHTPSVAVAALFPHLNHAGKSLDTRLTAPQHGHLLVSTNIWPMHGKHTQPRTRRTDSITNIVLDLNTHDILLWWLSRPACEHVFIVVCWGRQCKAIELQMVVCCRANVCIPTDMNFHMFYTCLVAWPSAHHTHCLSNNYTASWLAPYAWLRSRKWKKTLVWTLPTARDKQQMKFHRKVFLSRIVCMFMRALSWTC